MYSRLKGLRLLVPVLLLIGALFVIDLMSSLAEDLGRALLEHFIGVLLVFVATGIPATLALSSRSPGDVLSKITLLVISFAIALTGCEIFFRLVLLQNQMPRTDADFAITVSSGWPRRISLEKGPGVIRILGLADSFGRAGDLENYHYILEHHLREQSPRFEIVNFSVGGYDLAEELTILKRFGRRYRPDIVLHGFFVGNDFWIPDGEPFAFGGIPLRRQTDLDSWRPRHFVLREWIEDFFVAGQSTFLTIGRRNQSAVSGVLSNDEFLRIERRRMAITRGGISYDDEIWTDVSRQLDQIRDEVNRMGAKYMMVIHPDQFQVETSLFNELCERYHANPADYDVGRPQRFLWQYCKSRQIPCVDLLPAFSQKGHHGGLYLLRGTHYNANGNTLAAMTLFQFLKESGIVTGEMAPQPNTTLPEAGPR